VEDLGALADQIKQVAGVVEHGLFLDLSSPDAHILVGGPDGVFSL
jgi:ribose 5-phosphate isomerase